MSTSKKNKGIISLAVVFTVGFLALGTALMVAVATLTELSKNRNIKLGSQSFYTAEAAAREGAYQYQQDDSYSSGTAPLLNNTLNAEVVVTSSTWPYVEISGTAENKVTRREVVYDITVFPEGFAFDYAVFVQDNLNFSGNVTVNGDIFANNEINFTGSAEVNGDAFSPGEIEEVDNILGDIFSGVEPIPPPQINLDDYYVAATLIASSTGAEEYLNNETRGPSEVIYVDDTNETHIQGANTDLQGSLATLGNLTITGGTYTATENYAAIVVQGDLRIAGGATINGIVYVLGSASFGGGTNTINGSLLCAGEVSQTDLTGNTVINFDPDIVANWQDLFGLDTVSAQKPEIIQWREQ